MKNQGLFKRSMNESIKRLTLTAMFLAIGIILPFFFGQIPQIGSMLLPMHIPVFLCAFICGWQYGVPMAVILPLFRSLMFGRPNLYPEAISIAFEMAAYAAVAGIMYSRSKWQCIRSLYRSLIVAMVCGRVVRAAVQLSLLGISGKPFTFGAFFSGVILAGIPGIILQLILIPAVMLAFHRTKLVPLGHMKKNKSIHRKESNDK